MAGALPDTALPDTAPRFIISDIDGTFLDANHRVSQRTRDVVARATAAGTHFALATGRPFRWVLPVIEQLNVRPVCVTSNGAVLYDTAADTVLAAHTLDPQVQSEIYYTAQEVLLRHGGAQLACELPGTSAFDATEEQFIAEEAYSETPGLDGFGIMPTDDVLARPAVKLLLRNLSMTAPEMYELIAPHIDPQSAHVTYSMNDGLLEFAAPGVTKALGVAQLAGQYGVSQDATIAFGDMPNDIEMLRWVGTGVAMGNAADNVKDAADYVTSPNHQGGVADVLERWF
ncbi:HAD family hydrolase [Corynebacterium incognita]|uniref:HAD family hydrolase n=1 Tax=Corynebacterium incognita TaxID=2754725 RepID=A0A7G7CRW4_9CORY|nr:HAD family hydrolase [Corynebacterium incognita]QNE90330.1 HAD family hydrolase [Corynebacterium incognita]